jgi:hypothetical protein
LLDPEAPDTGFGLAPFGAAQDQHAY